MVLSYSTLVSASGVLGPALGLQAAWASPSPPGVLPPAPVDPPVVTPPLPLPTVVAATEEPPSTPLSVSPKCITLPPHPAPARAAAAAYRQHPSKLI